VLDAGAEAVFWAKAMLAQSTALAITARSFVRFIVGSLLLHSFNKTQKQVELFRR